MKIFIGCSGWNYKDWRGEFYPQKLPQKRWLEFYSGIFNTVEVNNSFYRLPKDSTLEKWRETVDKEFNFTLKGSRYVTQMKKLNEPEEGVKRFEGAAAVLKEKLSCILWQLPPNLHRNDEKLINFCKTLKSGNKNVIEFRHESWFNKKVYEILKEHNISICSISAPDFPEDMLVTNEVGYLRFHGRGRKWYDYDYSIEELKSWQEMIMNSGVKEMYIYFNNDIGVMAPKNAKQLQELFDKS